MSGIIINNRVIFFKTASQLFCSQKEAHFFNTHFAKALLYSLSPSRAGLVLPDVDKEMKECVGGPLSWGNVERAKENNNWRV